MEAPVDSATSDSSLPSRRKLFALLTAAVGAVGVGLARTTEVHAANGDPLVLGQGNSAAAVTTLYGELDVQTLRAGSGAGPTSFAPVVGMGSDRGVFGYASAMTGAIGVEGVGRSTGVRGQGYLGSGVLGVGGYAGVTGTGEVYGVRGSTSGSIREAVGVLAENAAGGLALLVSGKAQFSSTGKGQIARRATSAFVADTNIADTSLILVSLTSDPGDRGCVQWVEAQPGVGFTVHLTDRTREPTTFNYLVVERPV